MDDHRVAIIGSGIAGLACASRLRAAGVKPLILDKGRGIGGRTATRRTGAGLQFDHGAQYVTARGQDFQRVLAAAAGADRVGDWALSDGCRHVGIPGMTGLAEFLARGLEIRQNTFVRAVNEVERGCELVLDDRVLPVARLVLTVPAPQAIALLGDQHPFAGKLASVEMLPCLTLMAAISGAHRLSWTAHRDPSSPLSWIAHDSSKPGRPTRNCIVAHASPDWSVQHLEESPEKVTAEMLSMLCRHLGIPVSEVIHADVHRWRHAAVSRPLGRPLMRNTPGTLYLGGDWCLEARVEAAWTSGNAIALDILENQ